MGSVTEIVNGKTITIETSAKAKFVVQLQFIDVPEPGQPLADTVKEHLQKLALGKTVLFQTRGLSESNKLIGRVSIGNMDLSEQLLRDGAAWYAVLEKDSQDSKQREVYQATEDAAKSEKRGIWGVEGLKPAWEFRAEKQASKLPSETRKPEPSQSSRQIEPTQATRSPDKTANSATFKPKSLKSLSSAQEFFEECNERGLNFDVSFAECYSDKAVIQDTRTYPDGRTQILQFSAPQYKKLIVKLTPLVKKLNDYSTFSNVIYMPEGERVRISATRYSGRKNYYSPFSLLVGRDSSGSWQIYEQFTESQP